MTQIITYNNLNEHSERIAHFSSTRIGGVSEGKYASLNLGTHTLDKASNIKQNRELLAINLGISTTQIFNAHQIHGTAVKVVDKALIQLSEKDRKLELEGYDAFISNISGCCITATTADCVPVLLYDKAKNTVAAIHSGWKSTLENITQATINSLQDNFGTNAADIIAAIGPCIGKEVYEVGEDVYEKFFSKGFASKQLFKATTKGKYLFDIREAVRMQLIVGGVKNIDVSTYCTFRDDELFFSARRQGSDSGRMLSGIYLK